MEGWSLLISFIIGAVIGSFLNVLVYRSRNNTSLFSPNSFCPGCEYSIEWYNNIPILSFLLLGGRCNNCKEEISWQYFLVELWLALAFLFTAFINDYQSETVLLLRNWLIVAVLTFIFVYDLRFQRILDRVTLPAIVLVFLINVGFGVLTIESMALAALIAGGFFLLQYLVSRGRWIGGGDIRVGVLMGVILGWPNVLLALFLAYVSGAFVSIFLVLARKKSLASKTPFGVYLSLATFFTLFFGDQIISWYINLVLF